MLEHKIFDDYVKLDPSVGTLGWHPSRLLGWNPPGRLESQCSYSYVLDTGM